MDRALGDFIQQAFEVDAAVWDEDGVRDIAAKVAPASLGGLTNWLLRGDINHLWARWFLEGLADPLPYLEGTQQYAHLYKRVSDALASDAGLLPADERTQLASRLTKLLWRKIGRLEVGRRVVADRETRLFLWELYPRCWVCGAEFSDWARAAFLGEESDAEPRTPPFVDFYTSRGVKLLDLRIEVEHVVAHSSGGSSLLHNLRLACGWCNRVKSNRALIYDAEGAPRVRKHPTLGPVSVPQPFWVVRFLAMRGRCEDPSGCAARTSSDELTVAPRNIHGAPNPANLIVVCREHDPLRDVRLVASKFIPR
ncbi:HNH endonuclease [Geodermatophilus sp. YIM 151500]|uniref:HNH endonuclease n=1 Tax=Geodermatophilus sp. YIM 151500 TaxID=2984531 RepID=UPI0021E4C541|nr:HNH endonuclease [Geodermatophilus sp. YIM 151500]MCV2491661.1 HNH endonuclease [Geodermatophilus sp. YIM 151500]